MSFGAKIGLENIQMANDLLGIFSYIEVYYTPNVKPEKIPNARYVVHAPNSRFSVDLAKKKDSNINLVEEAINFASKINSKVVIVHVGSYPERSEKIIINNLKNIVKSAKKYDIRILVENLPLKSKYFSVQFGAKPKDIELILKKVKCGFVLDFSHACHAAFSYKTDYKKFILEFLKLNPEMFHLYDSISEQEEDVHLPFGKGDLDIKFFIKLIRNEDVTIEASSQTIKHYLDSMTFIKKFL